MDLDKQIIDKYTNAMAQLTYDNFRLSSVMENMEKENNNLNNKIKKLKSDKIIGKKVIDILEEKQEREEE